MVRIMKMEMRVGMIPTTEIEERAEDLDSVSLEGPRSLFNS